MLHAYFVKFSETKYVPKVFLLFVLLGKNKAMKRFILTLFTCVIVIFVINANTVFNTRLFKMIVCEIYDKTDCDKGRSATYIPQLYQSDEYISVQSEFNDYDNVHIIITNAQSVIVKDEFINVITGDENLYYIGDLNSGDYNIMLETDDLILVGNFII